MRPNFPTQPSDVTPGKLSAKDLRSTGRLIRACAELENILTLYLFEVAGVTPRAGRILVGKIGMRARVQAVLALTKGRTEERRKFRECYDNELYDAIVDCRNVVAHGVFLGLDRKKAYCFETDSWHMGEDDKFGLIVTTYASSTIQALAFEAEAMVVRFESELGLKALREKLRTQPLEVHPKALTPTKKE